MVPVKKYGNVFVVLQISCPKLPFTHSFDDIERCSISAKCRARPSLCVCVCVCVCFLDDMCAVFLILSLTFAPSLAKTGTILLLSINALLEIVCVIICVYVNLRMCSHDFVFAFTAIQSLDESC